MKITYTEFLEKNSELNFFDELAAKNYYRLLKMGDYQTALLYLIDVIENKLGWFEFNNTLKLIPVSFNIVDSRDIGQLLSYRIDNFIVNPAITGIMHNIDGNYLLSDIISIDPITDEFLIKKENIIMCDLMFDAATKKEKFLKIVTDDLIQNSISDSLDFTIRLLIYSRFFSPIDDLNLLHVKKLISALLNKKRLESLTNALVFLNANMSYDCIIFSRFNLLKSHTKQSYNELIRSSMTKYTIFSDILFSLDVFE